MNKEGVILKVVQSESNFFHIDICIYNSEHVTSEKISKWIMPTAKNLFENRRINPT